MSAGDLDTLECAHAPQARVDGQYSVYSYFCALIFSHRLRSDVANVDNQIFGDSPHTRTTVPGISSLFMVGCGVASTLDSYICIVRRGLITISPGPRDVHQGNLTMQP